MTEYLINNIYTCVQGEGCLVGTAMVLVRLQGCGVGCVWCDTKETWEINPAQQVVSFRALVGGNVNYLRANADEIAGYVVTYHPGPKWVLITGGEPAEQPLQALAEAFHKAGYKIALETSGTASGFIGAGIDWVCVSPKIDNPAGKPLLAEALILADELKFIVGKPIDIEKVDEFLARYAIKENAQILLQPLSVNPKATELCIETVQARGWRLSLQTHKYLALP